MSSVKDFILEQFVNKQIDRERTKRLLRELSEANLHEDIAVIGLAGRFAEATNVDQFWDFLKVSRDCIRDYPQSRKEDMYDILRNPYYAEVMLGRPVDEADLDRLYSVSGYLDRIDHFDSRFFGIPPLEADYMDPNQRIALEVAYEALENAGYGGESAIGSRTGVFLGRDQSNYSYYRMFSERHPMQLSGSWEGMVASRISYLLDLKGPCIMTDTACSAGSVSVHQAIQSLLLGECDMALAGGINLSSGGEPKTSFLSGATMDNVVSGDDSVRTFDARANGTLWGEGAGIVLLKPLKKALADRDHVRAVIKASAVNNDGTSNSITAPNALMQERVILDAWAKANVPAETITYVEAHGTGTVLGDPIEVKGLTNAFRRHTDRKQFCGIGSLKTTMGHMVAASGSASLAKVVRSLESGLLAPSSNFDVPNPYIDFTDSPLYVNDRLMPWDTDGEPRRAGISSFGFIRTNCHMVLEEAPRYRAAPQSRERYCLTVSAKTEAGLTALLGGYAAVLADSPWSLADICYTSNVGRGHHEHRVMIIAATKAQLAESVDRLRRHGPGTDAQQGIHHGVHAVVSDKRGDLRPGDITAQTGKRLSDSANATLAEYRSRGDAAALTALADAYVRGARVEFAEFYADEPRQRVPLPTYPFERIRHWAKPMRTSVRSFGAGETNPLLGTEISRSDSTVVFENRLSVDRHWVLSDHRIEHRPVVPGTTYLEMARAALAAVENTGSMRFENVFFLVPLAVEEGEEATVRTRLDRLERGYSFQVASAQEGEWVTHVEGRISPLGDADPLASVDIEAQQAAAIEVTDPYPTETDTGVFQFGARWDNVRAVWRHEAGALTLLRLPQGVPSETFGLHPAKLDNAVNLISQNSGETFLPYMYKSFVLLRPMPETFYSLIRTVRDDSDEGETITYDVDLVDVDGEVFARITDYTVKKVDWRRFSLSGPRRFLQVEWLSVPRVPADAAGGEVWAPVVLDNPAGRRLVAAVEAQGHRVVPCYVGERTDQGRHVFALHEDGAGPLAERLRQEGVDGVLFATDFTAPEHTDEAALTHRQRRATGVDALFELYRAFVAHRVKLARGLKVLGRHAWQVGPGDGVTDPYSAATEALAQVVGQEHRHLLVDVLDAGADVDLDFLVRESLGGTGGVLRAVRGTQTHLRRLRYAEAADEAGESPYRGGTFVVTGGAGGLGLSVAEEMVREGAERVILLGRRPLAEETARRVEKIVGAEYALCDVSREAEVRALAARLREESVTLGGIVHAAGVAGDGFLATKPRPAFDAVLASKVDGSLALTELAKEHPGAFLVFFSSITAIVGGQGQGDYCSANAFMDSLAVRARAEGVRALSINWPTWSEVGMAVRYGIGDGDSPFRALTVKDGLAWLGHFLRAPADGVVPTRFDLGALREQLDEMPFLLDEDVAAAVARAGTGGSSADGEAAEVRVVGLSDPNQTQLRIGAVYGAVLGMTEVDAHESFQDLGGNSLMTAQLLQKIEDVYPGRIDIADLYSYASVVSLAGYIDERVAAESGPAAPGAAHLGEMDQSLQDVLAEIGDAELTTMFAAETGGAGRNQG
ncbi:SDR family NAD(P)-dependent oxidoreductase [Verrucosispora sp. NA02020]|uniref:SDR family NAD(P)-dependent oxidoreductase n=1 Tax=Verrucosispora sp. NA02020 TaxID=2742132 RepID=UPI0015901789|nr:SDR family NAD(P)-dependent oxidoreductase [Verrucosispora sp. NA02020]QKW15147.1 SDR family NAD(P)-dependent oxidoreductase [Verrucosispora sp. NA02020]